MIRCVRNQLTHIIYYDSLIGDLEYALKWKIHDTIGRIGSSEDTFTRFYVYDFIIMIIIIRFGIDPGIYNTSIAATSNNLMIV